MGKTIDSKQDKISRTIGWAMLIFAVSLAILLVVLFVALISVMFFDSATECIGKLLGTKGDKAETIRLIGMAMGGTLFSGGIAILNQWANAQWRATEVQATVSEVHATAAEVHATSTKAQVENNRLVEEGHTQERFKAATEHLGDDSTSVRIAAFYEFVHLMKDKGKKYQKNILDILYSQVPTGPGTKGDEKPMYPPEKPAKDVQVLLNILFKSQDIDRSHIKPNHQGVYSLEVDLSGVYLCKADLRGADLRGVNLSGACLIETNLSKADLSGASLHGANLHEADLRGADLHGADLRGAHLLEANLSGANLSGVDLGHANLSDADLSDADLLKAQLGGALYSNNTRFPEWLYFPTSPDSRNEMTFPEGFIARKK